MPASDISHIVDNDLLDALLQPDLQAAYPRDSRAFVRIDTSLRVYWHTIFDACPDLLRLADADGLAIYRPFMAWANARQLSMNWAIHLWLHEWLTASPFKGDITSAVTETLMSAAAARWAISDRSEQCGIVITAIGVPTYIACWKCHRVDQGRQVERIELDAPLPLPTIRLAYFPVLTFELDRFDRWHAIPQ
jgi:uncharacterized repeat protein (TIGR04061 family)